MKQDLTSRLNDTKSEMNDLLVTINNREASLNMPAEGSRYRVMAENVPDFLCFPESDIVCSERVGKRIFWMNLFSPAGTFYSAF